MTDAAAPPAGALATRSKAGRRAWVSFATGLEIFNIPIVYVIFVPYFTNTMGGDFASGQTLWGYAAGIGGLIGALMSPPLGFAAEHPARRRLFLTIALFANAVPAFFLALAAPGIAGPMLVVVLVALAVATAANDINYALLGGMLVDVAPSSVMGRTSGAAVSVGWAFGIVVSLLYFGAFVVSDPFGLGLDPAQGHAERLIGPVSGVLMLALCAPLLLLRPPPPPARPERSFGTWLKEETAVLLKERAVALAVGARLVYWSGVALLGLFGTGFARSVFGWDTLTAGGFGLLVLAFGALGAFIGGRLDDRFGSRNALIISLVGLAVSMGLILTLEPDRIFFLIPLPTDPVVASFTIAEIAAYGLGALAGFFVGPTGPISRTLVSRLAPPGRTARYFGVAALAGNATNAFGPFAVAIVTQATDNARLGLLAGPGFLLLGALIVLLLPPAKEARTDEAQPVRPSLDPLTPSR